MGELGERCGIGDARLASQCDRVRVIPHKERGGLVQPVRGAAVRDAEREGRYWEVWVEGAVFLGR